MRCGRRLTAAAFILLCSTASFPACSAVEELSLESKDGARTALLLWPDGTSPMEALPLVILLHGRGASAAGSLGLRKSIPAPLSAWVAIAERDKVAILALQGTRGRSELAGWNDCREDDPSKPGADDTGYANLVLRQVTSRHLIDPTRVYLMGMSNGAMMTFRLGQELELPVAAIAAVAGTMPAGDGCPPPQRPLSVLLIEGMSDPLVPYEGGAVHFGSAEMGSILSADETAARWRAIDHLDSLEVTDQLPRLLASEAKSSATRTIWGHDLTGFQVELISIDGGGHAEPSVAHPYGRIYLGLAGVQNHDFESAEEAWRFFKPKQARMR